jgi:predicted phosphohydrolase
MKIFAISDLHLTNSSDKPMDVFGGNWVGYWERIKANWTKTVSADDAVLIAGDISWAMTLDKAKADLEEIDGLPGRKFLIEGNHDYWWSSYKKVKELPLSTMSFIQYTAVKLGGFIICGTRGWTAPERDASQKEDDAKIYSREVNRLRLSLDCARRLCVDGEEIIAMTHFPPFNSRFDASAFTELFSEYGVKKIVYGHLHGDRSRYKAAVKKDGAEYLLTSCDFLNNNPLQIF